MMHAQGQLGVPGAGLPGQQQQPQQMQQMQMQQMQMQQMQPGPQQQHGTMGNQSIMQQQVGMGLGSQMQHLAQPGIQMQQNQQAAVMQQQQQQQGMQGQIRQSSMNWRSNADYQQREEMIGHIFRLFSEKKSQNMKQEFRDKLPVFVRKLEEALYQMAPSKEEYINRGTLEARLREAARRIAPNAGQRPGQPQTPGLDNLMNPNAGNQMATPANGMIGGQQFTQPQQRSPMLYGQQGIQSNQTMGLNQTAGRQIPNVNHGQVQGHAQANGNFHVSQSTQGVPQANAQVSLIRGSASRGESNFGQSATGVFQIGVNRPQIPNGPTAGQYTQDSNGIMQQQQQQQQQQIHMQNVQGSPALMLNNLHNNLIPVQQSGHQGMIGVSGMQINQNVPNNMQASPRLQMQANQQLQNQASMLQQRQNQLVNQHRQQEANMQMNPVAGNQNMMGNMMNQPGMNQTAQTMIPQQGIPSQQTQPNGQQQQPRPLTQQEMEVVRKQQRWLMFLRHCLKCTSSGGQCPQMGEKCKFGQELIRHIESCASTDCTVSHCLDSKKLLRHHKTCSNARCPICGPINTHLGLNQVSAQAAGRVPPSPSPIQQPSVVIQPVQPQIPPNQAQTHQQVNQQRQLIHMQHQQQQLQNAMRGSAAMNQNGGMMNNPGMMPTPGATNGSLIPTPGLVGPPKQASNVQSTFVGMPMTHDAHRSSNLPNQAQTHLGGNMMHMPGASTGMTPNQNGAGMMMPIMPQGMIPTPNSTPGFPSQGMTTDLSINAEHVQKRPKIEGYAAPIVNHGMGAIKTEIKTDLPTGPGASSQLAVKQENKPPAGSQVTSLLQKFTADQIRTYLLKVREDVQADLNAKKPGRKADESKHPPPALDETPCAVCQNPKKSWFEPPVLYCYKCDKRIKENLTYYHAQLKSQDPMKTGGPSRDFYWCHSCFSEVAREKGETIHIEGEEVSKMSILKKKNDDIQEEPWVQCDSCDAWVHQICGLFNRLLNDENNTHYCCPNCLLKGLESGTRKPVVERCAPLLGAKELPVSKLSQFLEDYLARSLSVEREERARLSSKAVHEVPAVEGLTVRVVNNVLKKCETKPHFYETFKDKNYPQSFNYRQKVILLFQNLDGVDVCLFCMYTQEYGDNNDPPNRRVSYLSYLDSVKYFRPEGVAAANHGVALRTFVYHEIIIGYLSYLRQRGFHQMFIWACPPTQGDDYILYAHPKTQKNPLLSKLREWYFKMLRRAHEAGIVTRVSNLFDTYFEGGKDHKLEKCSAMDVPYFEGDYWPGVAETLLKTIGEEQKAAAAGKKGSTKKGSTSRNKMSKTKVLSGSATTDEQLMAKLGEAISGGACNKEDFMVVHLQHVCSSCRNCISGTKRYYVEPPPLNSERKFEGIKLENSSCSMGSFQLCESCYNVECSKTSAYGGPSSTRNRSLPGGLSTHDLQAADVPTLPSTTEEWDPDMDCEIFNTRQQFLSLCQGNHYQFDTTRRTRHSSMMMLYHLHNPSAPAFAGTCNICNVEIEPGDGWRCTVCDDFDMCKTCHARNTPHEHPLVAQAAKGSKNDLDRRRLLQQQVTQTLEIVKHSSSCTRENCSYLKCATAKKVIEHMKEMAILRIQQNQPHDCRHCRQMWKILRYHATICKANNCQVYMCKELKENARRQAARQEQHRLQAYQDMLQQQRMQT